MLQLELSILYTDRLSLVCETTP